MRLWLSRGSSISVREQLVTQVVLSILSGDLKPAQRLPSTRELARRFHVHPNTVSAGYRQLEQDSWVEFRKGSGVYVRPQRSHTSAPTLVLDKLIADFFLAARNLTLRSLWSVSACGNGLSCNLQISFCSLSQT